MKTVLQTLSTRNFVVAVTFFAALAILLNSCSSSSKVTHHHQQHLKSKHSGSHHLNTTNRGCGWANN